MDKINDLNKELFELNAQLLSLRITVAKKDAEIRVLSQNLTALNILQETIKKTLISGNGRLNKDLQKNLNEILKKAPDMAPDNDFLTFETSALLNALSGKTSSQDVQRWIPEILQGGKHPPNDD